MAKELYKCITTHDDDEPSMAALVSGEVLRDTKKRRRRTVEDGQRFGHLTLSKTDRVGKKYLCRCDCGSLIYLTLKELLNRDRLGVGCLLLYCEFGCDQVKVWHNPPYALRLQLRKLLLLCPEEVCAEWGGYAGDTRVGQNAGEGRMIAELTQHIKRKRHKWWITRIDPALPYNWCNVKMLSYPSIDLFGSRSRYIMLGDQLLSTYSVSQIFSVPHDWVNELRLRYLDDSVVMEKVLKQAEKI